jgi:hypothetical protein
VTDNKGKFNEISVKRFEVAHKIDCRHVVFVKSCMEQEVPGVARRGGAGLMFTDFKMGAVYNEASLLQTCIRHFGMGAR